jgi:hypothetical protein
MLQCKENCGLLYTIILENYLKYTCLNTNNVNVNGIWFLIYFTMLYQRLCLCNNSKMRWWL